jgi:hypothetical protein
LETGQTVDFTVRWSDGTWIGEEFRAAVVPSLAANRSCGTGL